MDQLGPIVLGGVLLAAAMAAGWWRWVGPRRPLLSLPAILLLMLIVLTLTGAALGGPLWWFHADGTFSWALPPLASRMLGAAAASFVVACVMVLERPAPRRLRLMLILLATYLWPLVLAILAFHLDRFDPDELLTYSFFAIAGSMSAATGWFLVRPAEVQGVGDNPTESSVPVATWLRVLAAITGAWGLAVFVVDDGPWSAVWAWPGDLLTSRLIGVMLLTIAVGSLFAFRYADTARVMLAMSAVYGAGIALASLWQRFDDLPVKPAYLVVFGGLAAVSALLLFAERRWPDDARRA